MNTNNKIKAVVEEIGDFVLFNDEQHEARIKNWLQHRLEALVREERERIALQAHNKTKWADECLGKQVILRSALIDALTPPTTNNKN